MANVAFPKLSLALLSKGRRKITVMFHCDLR